jgi:hypothetical protein
MAWIHFQAAEGSAKRLNHEEHEEHEGEQDERCKSRSILFALLRVLRTFVFFVAAFSPSWTASRRNAGCIFQPDRRRSDKSNKRLNHEEHEEHEGEQDERCKSRSIVFALLRVLRTFVFFVAAF